MLIYDAAQQEALYLEYYPKVLGYIKGRVTNLSDTEDLASAVFVKVYKNLPGFDAEKASLSTWIYTITRNTVIDYFRTGQTFVPLSELETAADDTEDALLREEQLEMLACALKKIDERERDLVILHYYKEKNLTEIAALMGISYSYVKILHKKALKALQALLR